jgi:hypothetical protein
MTSGLAQGLNRACTESRPAAVPVGDAAACDGAPRSPRRTRAPIVRSFVATSSPLSVRARCLRWRVAPIVLAALVGASGACAPLPPPAPAHGDPRGPSLAEIAGHGVRSPRIDAYELEADTLEEAQREAASYCPRGVASLVQRDTRVRERCRVSQRAPHTLGGLATHGRKFRERPCGDEESAPSALTGVFLLQCSARRRR